MRAPPSKLLSIFLLAYKISRRIIVRFGYYYKFGIVGILLLYGSLIITSFNPNLYLNQLLIVFKLTFIHAEGMKHQDFASLFTSCRYYNYPMYLLALSLQYPCFPSFLSLSDFFDCCDIVLCIFIFRAPDAIKIKYEFLLCPVISLVLGVTSYLTMGKEFQQFDPISFGPLFVLITLLIYSGRPLYLAWTFDRSAPPTVHASKRDLETFISLMDHVEFR